MITINITDSVDIDCDAIKRTVSTVQMQADINDYLDINLNEGLMQLPITPQDLDEGVYDGRIECLRWIDDKSLMRASDGMIKDPTNSIGIVCNTLFDNFVSNQTQYTTI